MSQAAKRARLDRNTNEEEEYEPTTTSTQSRKQTTFSPVPLDSEGTNRLVKDVIRYFLTCEYKKTIIRKDDINKKVLHEHSRQYNTIFKAAREQLLDTFGMALLEIPAKDIKGRNKPPATATGSSQQPASQGRTPSTHSYILYNCLNKDLEAYKVIHQTDEEYASMGLLYFILSVILVNEQELQERELLGYLTSAGLESQSDTFGDLGKMLALYVKQGYLQKFKETMDNQDSYQWGPRSKSEISYKDLIKFMSTVCEPDDEKDFEEAIFKSAGF
ncbi:unnamed protein product [Absidia cylindrospora]